MFSHWSISVHPDSHASRTRYEDAPALPIYDDFAWTDPKNVRPALSSMVLPHEHSLCNGRISISHHDGQTSSSSVRASICWLAHTDESDAMGLVEVVQLRAVRIIFASSDQLRQQGATQWRCDETVAVRLRISIYVAIEDARKTAVLTQ